MQQAKERMTRDVCADGFSVKNAQKRGGTSGAISAAGKKNCTKKTVSLTERKRRKRRKRRIRQAKRITALAVLLLIAAGAVTGIATGIRAIAGAVSEKGTKEIRAETPEIQEVDVVAEEMKLYGCELYGIYEYPFNTMSQDWGADDVEGFYYHEISDEAKAAGGTMPVIMQVYTYIVCKQYGVDYEMVFALIERESMCRWDIVGDDGESAGYMQIQGRWHQDRMERLGVSDLKNPFQNVRVGVDYLAELQERTDGNNMDTLAAYNYGYAGAKRCLWDKGVHEYSYNTEIMERAQELKQETAAGRAVTEE